MGKFQDVGEEVHSTRTVEGECHASSVVCKQIKIELPWCISPPVPISIILSTFDLFLFIVLSFGFIDAQVHQSTTSFPRQPFLFNLINLPDQHRHGAPRDTSVLVRGKCIREEQANKVSPVGIRIAHPQACHLYSTIQVNYPVNVL